ncbi:hypothetical protein STCU_12289 [Strigomonas culicis]|uniref:Uncharacterized protein n=1 Tax=Strigomonas culicis TaxID=28005 RepID=S9UKK1_9TRYP|nr:hypothetical protein STCU_12289 [Strigomonas culicis]|eukprot:EPY15171.1 hypothetical protein STCU_12289 [Strigomonas culicis]
MLDNLLWFFSFTTHIVMVAIVIIGTGKSVLPWNKKVHTYRFPRPPSLSLFRFFFFLDNSIISFFFSFVCLFFNYLPKLYHHFFFTDIIVCLFISNCI